MSTASRDVLLRSLLSSVRRTFYNDATTPGVVLAELTYSETYASIVRYPNGPNGEKTVVVWAKAPNLSEALEGLALAWIVQRKRVSHLRQKQGKSSRDFERLLRAVLP